MKVKNKIKTAKGHDMKLGKKKLTRRLLSLEFIVQDLKSELLRLKAESKHDTTIAKSDDGDAS